MRKEWRLILDEGGDAFFNMAKDEVLFTTYFKRKQPTLRIYSWSVPAISLGYFQKVEETLNLLAMVKRRIFFVRRITGGAAILHNEDITYSLSLSTEDLNLSRSVKSSYKVLCSFLLNFYRGLGLNPCFPSDNDSKYGNFCFSTIHSYDIIIGNKKIGGNAQKRRRNFIFHQGSIPIKVNFDLVRELIKGVGYLEDKTLGLKDLVRDTHNWVEWRERLAFSFQETFGVRFFIDKLSKEEEEQVSYLKEHKYYSYEWNFKFKKTILVE